VERIQYEAGDLLIAAQQSWSGTHYIYWRSLGCKHEPSKEGSDMTGKLVVSLVAASLIFAGTAFAQQPPREPQAPARGQPGTMMRPGMMGHGDWAPWMMGMGRHHGMMMAPGMIQAFAEGKLAFLKSWLDITEAQNGPWNAFAEVVRAQAKSMAESRQKRMPAAGQPEVALPQWVDLHLQMMEEHLAAMKKIKPALDALYQAMTPEQRQKADQLIRMG
jgi:LTXXQ motif family protein